MAKLDFKAVAGMVGASIVLTILIVLGQTYRHQCVGKGNNFDECWDKGLAIAGMREGGPLSAGVVIGYIIGAAGKEKEKQEKYKEGYWTYNPDLHKDDA